MFAGVALAEPFGPYGADVVRVVDGDTVVLDVRIFHGLSQRTTVRIDGINTPEKRGAPPCEIAAGIAATAFTTAWLDAGSNAVSVVIRGLDKYGRWLGDITRADGGFLRRALVAAGHARPYRGEKRGPWC